MKYDLVILCSGCSQVGESIPIEAANVRSRLREAMLKLRWISTGSEIWCQQCAPHWKDFTDDNRIVRRILETRSNQMRALSQELDDARQRLEEYEAQSQPFDESPTPGDVDRNLRH